MIMSGYSRLHMVQNGDKRLQLQEVISGPIIRFDKWLEVIINGLPEVKRRDKCLYYKWLQAIQVAKLAIHSTHQFV